MPEVIIVPAFFATVGYIVWVWVNASQRKQRVKLLTEFHSRLLDKLGSVKDFGEFMQTEAGGRLLADLAAEPMTTGPHERILRAAQIGVVLICLGVGLLILSFFSPSWPGRSQDGLNAVGAIALSLGIGFTLSAAASHRLAGMLGLLNRGPEQRSEPASTRA